MENYRKYRGIIENYGKCGEIMENVWKITENVWKIMKNVWKM